MTTMSTATQKPKTSNGAAKQATGMTDSDLLPCQDNIAVAAYFRAEQRGFTPGEDQADWFQAEAEYKSSSSQQTA